MNLQEQINRINEMMGILTEDRRAHAFFKFLDKKLNEKWYSASLGVKPVDDAVKMAINDGYIHHILRLMVVGNFMNLVGIHPDDVYKWFMEFSLDSYDWVMVGNVYSMAMWSDGGLTMRKPYISGSGYIMKMSNYPRDKTTNNTNTNTWQQQWDDIFHDFINSSMKPAALFFVYDLI